MVWVFQGFCKLAAVERYQHEWGGGLWAPGEDGERDLLRQNDLLDFLWVYHEGERYQHE